MARALEHARQREQFGRPIGRFEMIQRKFAVIGAECYAADSAWMLTAGMVDRGGIDYSLETAACKIFCSELSNRAANEALQIAGGIGYSKEYPYEQAVRDARINLIFEGTNEILRALIALMALQQPGERLKELGDAFRRPIRSLGAISSYLTGRARRTIAKPSFTRVHPSLEREAHMVAELAHELAIGAERALMRHGRRIIERQYLQERHGQRRDRDLPRHGDTVAHDLGVAARRCDGGEHDRGDGLRASVRADGVPPRAAPPSRAAPQPGCADERPRRARAGDRRGGPAAAHGPLTRR